MIITDDVLKFIYNYDLCSFEYVLCCRDKKTNEIVMPSRKGVYGSCLDHLARRMWSTLHKSGTWHLFSEKGYMGEPSLDITGLEAGAIFNTRNKIVDADARKKAKELSHYLDLPDITFFRDNADYYMYVPFTKDLMYPPILQGFIRCLRDFIGDSKCPYFFHTNRRVSYTYKEFKDIFIKYLDNLRVDGSTKIHKYMYTVTIYRHINITEVNDVMCYMQCLNLIADMEGQRIHGMTADEYFKRSKE